jgi:hypothetical protein
MMINSWQDVRRRARCDLNLRGREPVTYQEFSSGRTAVMCNHQPKCPSYGATDAAAAHVVTAHPEQGWSLLCNGVLLFDDGGRLLPDGRVVEPPMTLPDLVHLKAA